MFNQGQIYEEDASVNVGNGPCVIPQFDPS